MTIAEYLELLGIREDEHVGILGIRGEQRGTAVRLRDDVTEVIDRIPVDTETYLAPNPVAGPARDNKGRGTEEQVTRAACIYADLDIKTGACPDLATAILLVNEISGLIEERPIALVFSGGGLQPIWALEECDPATGKVLLTRFSRLVRSVANLRDIKCDSVFDLARVLRVPGSFNHKYGSPRLVTISAGSGAPIEPATLAERFDEFGISEDPDDGKLGREVVLPQSDWTWASHDQSCNYMVWTTRGWMEEVVPERHPWAMNKLVRLECMRRNGCLTEEQYVYWQDQIQRRFLNLLATQAPIRPLKKLEWSDVQNAAMDRAECKTAIELARELGRRDGTGHVHLMAAPVQPPQTHAVGGSVAATAPVTPTLASVTQLRPEAPAIGSGMTDTGNARRMVDEHADVLRYVPKHKSWMHWTGVCWELDPDDSAAFEAARHTVLSLPVPPGDKEALKWRKASLSKNNRVAMVRLAQADPDMQAHPIMFDTRAHELNTPDGIVNLRNGELTDHDRKVWHTKVTGVGFDPVALCPQWDQFLRTTFDGKPELMDFMQQLAGYACIGEVTHHILPFLYGEVGQNGKSVLLRVFQQCLGNYAITLPVSALVMGRGSHTEDTANLPGARLAICSEIGQDTKWDEERIKSLTGGDMLTGRRLYGHKFEYVPTHTIMLAANDKPRVEAGGKSFFRRLTLVPFEHSIPDGDINENLAGQLLAEEGPAILSWMVRGSIDVLDNGLRLPVSVVSATEEYQQSEDEIGEWIEECCERWPDFPQPIAKLYGSYTRWCESSGLKPKNKNAFGRLLTKHGVPSTRTMDARMRLGLKLIIDPDQARRY